MGHGCTSKRCAGWQPLSSGVVCFAVVSSGLQGTELPCSKALLDDLGAVRPSQVCCTDLRGVFESEPEKEHLKLCYNSNFQKMEWLGF